MMGETALKSDWMYRLLPDSHCVLLPLMESIEIRGQLIQHPFKVGVVSIKHFSAFSGTVCSTGKRSHTQTHPHPYIIPTPETPHERLFVSWYLSHRKEGTFNFNDRWRPWRENFAYITNLRGHLSIQQTDHLIAASRINARYNQWTPTSKQFKLAYSKPACSVQKDLWWSQMLPEPSLWLYDGHVPWEKHQG